LHVVRLIDWQHSSESIFPPFLFAGIPERLQHYDDLFSQFMTQPSLPEKLDDLDETQEKEPYRRRLVHYHYVKNTKEYNELHYATLTDPMGMLRRRLFCYASDRWEGGTLALKVAPINVTENWETLTEGGPRCPVMFDAEDVRETRKLDAERREADENLEVCGKIISFGVPVERYEEAMTCTKQLKEVTLAEAKSEKVRAQIAAHWPLDEMDEEEYM
jgi:hypothetical protein